MASLRAGMSIIFESLGNRLKYLITASSIVLFRLATAGNSIIIVGLVSKGSFKLAHPTHQVQFPWFEARVLIPAIFRSEVTWNAIS